MIRRFVLGLMWGFTLGVFYRETAEYLERTARNAPPKRRTA